MHNDCDLCDYKLENGYTIILQQRQPLAEKKEEENGFKFMVKKEEESNTKITIKEEYEPQPETSKGEQELSEEERKQKIKEELGEDVLREIEAADGANGDEEPCKQCKDKKKNCKECGCQVCGGKTPVERLLFCDECEFLTHFECLTTPIESLDELP